MVGVKERGWGGGDSSRMRTRVFRHGAAFGNPPRQPACKQMCSEQISVPCRAPAAL